MGRRFDPRDRFFKKAKGEGYRARSAYKVKEICDRHHLLGRGRAVLDLGAAPGGFLQVIADAVGSGGRVVGVDLQAIRDLPQAWVSTLQADVEDPALEERIRGLHGEAFDLVVSDMAPSTTGAAPTDVARSLRLVERALDLADGLLRPGGNFVAKVFMGSGFEELVGEVRERYGKVRIMRPEAVRTRSRECYVVGLGRRSGPPSST
jgi:23S rRNA (uridine2552-2'-O)-methyltransferase